ncbi:MAG TPA: class I SAM-dependent methyltransferase, partial [Candidatus Eisenbacteria bacterium]|nr:class I SAM-dependent methyltransferase [Candidatus Eisenbacteria bacterium]
FDRVVAVEPEDAMRRRLSGAEALAGAAEAIPVVDGSADAVFAAEAFHKFDGERTVPEIARVLRPGGTLVVLEAAAPAPGPFAPFHRFYLRRIVPLAGRLSPDPSAYAYLSRSIFEFGSGPEFEAALAAAGFLTTGRRQFMLGATRLWIAERAGQESAAGSTGPGTGQDFAAAAPGRMQNARAHGANGVNLPRGADRLTGEWRAWTGVQLALSVALTAAFVQALLVLLNSRDDLPLNGWQRNGAWLLVVGGLLVFGLRSVQLVLRFLGARTRP